ncbi:MAG: hypothetical protein R3293_13575 [Candidatus Promineifilaceae bacterium]|nr:hypothetical protein [Candidatus Promineifilaceae bacterium]
MNDENTLILHDLIILEEMASNMELYLDSNAVDWTIPRVNMPKLTIGGYLMRQHRLTTLETRLEAEQQTRLRSAIKQFDGALVERIVRFETRAHQELHRRISEWMGHMRELGSRTLADINYYAGIVDTRVVITSLIDKLQVQPFKLQEGILESVHALDSNLKARTDHHPFIWDPLWMPAYPPDKYWWLYCRPKHAVST